MEEIEPADQRRWKRIVDFPPVAMVIALISVIVPAGLVAGLFERALPPSPLASMASQIVMTAAIVASYKLAVRHLGVREHDDLAGPRAGRELAAGLAFGGILFALIVAAVALAGFYRITGAGDTSNLWPSLISDGLAPAVAEEVIFRAILFRWIEEFAGSWIALFVSAALFGLSHTENPNADVISTVGIMLEGGILLGGAYMLTRRLWLPMGIHAAWNVTQGEVFDVPVSGTDSHGLVDATLRGPALLTGGGFGLEASVICIAIGTAAGLTLVFLAVRQGQVMKPSWLTPVSSRSR
jgi:membrane protease YdiL (CAAX protease family)